MSFGVIPDHVLADPRLSPGPKAVFAALTVLAIDGRTVESQATIADAAGLPERTTRAHLQTLANLGIIHIRATYAGAGRRGPNAYIIHGNAWEADRWEEHTAAENWGEPGWQKTGGLPEEMPNDSEPAETVCPTEISRRKETLILRLDQDQKHIATARQKTGGLTLAVLELYREILAELPQPQTPLGKTIETALRARIQEHPDLEWWRSYFTRVAAAPWLTGKKASADGTTFRATLQWLTGPRNLDKVMAGNYDAAPTRPTAAAQQTAKPAGNDATWNLSTDQWAEHAQLEDQWRLEHPEASARFCAARGASPYLSELRQWRATGQRPRP